MSLQQAIHMMQRSFSYLYPSTLALLLSIPTHLAILLPIPEPLYFCPYSEAVACASSM